MTRFFTSDHHFFHSNVIRYCSRPYASVEEMNEDLVAKWNAVVSPEDTIYYLGDFSMAFRPVETFTARLNGNKFLIAGNHDWCHPANKKSRGEGNRDKWIDKYEEHGWMVLPIHMSIQLAGFMPTIASHMPYKGDSTDEKYQNHRLEDEGTVLLCGHVHQHWQTKLTPKGTLMVNVGVDVWGMTPVSEEELVKLIVETLQVVKHGE